MASPHDEPTRVVREDPDRAGLLYAGTEFGMYISFDNGAHWQSFQLNLPVTPVTDIKIAHKDLILSTQGRSFWILDNLTPLHQIKESTATESAALFTPREAIRTGGRGGGGFGRGGGIQYPQPGAQIDYFLNSAPAGDMKMEILDGAGKVIRTFASGNAAAAAEEPAVDFAPPAMKKAAEEAGVAAAVDAEPSCVWINPPASTASPGTCAIPAPGKAPRALKDPMAPKPCPENTQCV